LLFFRWRIGPQGIQGIQGNRDFTGVMGSTGPLGYYLIKRSLI